MGLNMIHLYLQGVPRIRNLLIDAKIDKSGIEEIKTLDVAKPTIMDFKEFNYENCSLIDCISLLQSVLNSPHAYSQNKAFTKHIVDAMMQSFEEKLELEVSIPGKLYDEWEPTIKINIAKQRFNRGHINNF